MRAGAAFVLGVFLIALVPAARAAEVDDGWQHTIDGAGRSEPPACESRRADGVRAAARIDQVIGTAASMRADVPAMSRRPTLRLFARGYPAPRELTRRFVPRFESGDPPRR